MAASILLTTAMALIFGCSSNDKATTPVQFTYPKEYTGTYRVVENWLTPDSDWTQCQATFSFERDYVFHMWVDKGSVVTDKAPCSVEGTYQFTGDSLEITVTNPNLLTDICVLEWKPEGKYRYIIDGDYIVFEIRTPDPYRKIEFKGR
jgi:hypothetical protein